MALSKNDKIIHTNWGYWDGIAASKTGRYPPWAKSWQKHPFDKYYGNGFWIGFYNEPAPPYAITGKK